MEHVKKSKLQTSARLRSVIPAKAGIHFSRWNKTLAWVPAFAGTTLRPGFNRFADFFTPSKAGLDTLALERQLRIGFRLPARVPT